MSGIDWGFVVGWLIGTLIGNVAILAYQAWRLRRERAKRAREEAESNAAFLALLDHLATHGHTHHKHAANARREGSN